MRLRSVRKFSRGEVLARSRNRARQMNETWPELISPCSAITFPLLNIDSPNIHSDFKVFFLSMYRLGIFVWL
jgi:hypothetical protein